MTVELICLIFLSGSKLLSISFSISSIRTKCCIHLHVIAHVYDEGEGVQIRPWQIVPNAACIMLCWQLLEMIMLSLKSVLCSHYAHIMLNYVMGLTFDPRVKPPVVN